MKKAVKILTVLSVLLTMNTYGQVTMKLVLDRDHYIQYEPANLQLTLRNDSGRSLVFGSSPESGGYMTFDVRDLRGNIVRRMMTDKRDLKNRVVLNTNGRPKRVPVPLNPVNGLRLSAGVQRSVVVPLNQFFDIQAPGHYEVSARVSHPLLSKDFVSEKVKFQVHGGVSVVEKLVGSGDVGIDGMIPMRRCTIIKCHIEKFDQLALKIEDDKVVYTVQRLGLGASGVVPEIDVDARSHLHILMQVASRLFEYQVYTLEGERKQRHVYVVEKSVPRLIRDPDVGRVMVAGGTLGIAGVDYNVAESAATTSRDAIPDRVVEALEEADKLIIERPVRDKKKQ
jgi:hypothetical protein